MAGKQHLIAHARKLAIEIPGLDGIDMSISTVNRDAREVAAELCDRLREAGVLDRPSG